MYLLAWLSANLLTVILAGLISVLFFLTIAHLVRSQKQSNGTCGCGCAGCSHRGACHDASEAKPRQ